MSFSLIIFDYDGVLIDSLGDAISVGTEYCRSISHDRVPTKETIDSVSDIRYAKSAGVQSIAATWDWQSQDKLVKEEPDFIVHSVQELAAIIDSEYTT